MEGGDHLAHERNKAEFNVDDMKIVWAGSRHAFEVSNRMSRLVASDPVSVCVCHTRVCVCVPVKLRCKSCSYCLNDMLGL